MTDSVSPGPGRPKDPAKRAAILDAARVLFLAKGYEGSSMDAIATEAGVSKLTLYSHFKDKEALFCAAVALTCEAQLPRQLFELPEGMPLDAVLRRLGQAFWRLVNSPESVGLHRVMVSMGKQNPSLSRMFFEAGPKQVLDELRGLLERARARGLLAFEDGAPAADHFCAMIKGTHHFHLLIGYAEPLDQAAIEAQVADVVDVFMRAYRR
ncbi:TetR/AcrR family transcriptional regulator [Stutzerimonas nosocomialis]|uniref:TetR/AcrR family transcriptional regulator n=1 Tax=Stutzerimonas nosocomialis TaxID=1056496 RepID=A0A5R9QFH1_9GAMM|nr:TetR/AcrR family transcriptional regulator [Stutzerimonas nosocomialis]TLX55437.1 TetR/AcrR family transcriptional regulator [Stutzerimonas nosocomialis]TLX63750.1 TetR/AcrR family transcriptional regulator [Stutzerimonas nosocomialis]